MDLIHSCHDPLPCRYCTENADFCRILGRMFWVNYYMTRSRNGTCIHMPEAREAFEAAEQQLPQELRLRARPLGHRPRGPSHLTLPHHALDLGSLDGARDLSRPLCIPSWPFYQAEFIQDAHGRPHHLRWTLGGIFDDVTYIALPRGSRDQGSSDDESSHPYGPSAGGIPTRGRGGRAEPEMPGPRHSNQHHHHGTSAYGSSSPDDIDSDSEDFPSSGLESSGFGGGSQARPSMEGRRGSGSGLWRDVERQADMGQRRDPGSRSWRDAVRQAGMGQRRGSGSGSGSWRDAERQADMGQRRGSGSGSGSWRDVERQADMGQRRGPGA